MSVTFHFKSYFCDIAIKFSYELTVESESSNVITLTTLPSALEYKIS